MTSTSESTPTAAKKYSLGSRGKILIRRVHLLAGLFLLPWVFLYGITGGMFNHQGLFPEIESQHVTSTELATSAFQNFPAPGQLAQQVTEAIADASNDATITLMKEHRAEFTNPVQFELRADGQHYVVRIDPVARDANMVLHPEKKEVLEPLLSDIRNLKLSPNPQQIARNTVRDILDTRQLEADQPPRPLGWTKLNFLASIDGEPARVTYVLKDGHVDITRHTGEDGMSMRQFFLQLHTSHGQPPHWNGRLFWSLVVDAMAIAMVCWGITGLFMWWQLKRMRVAGSIVIAASLLTAGALYWSMLDFYATTKL